MSRAIGLSLRLTTQKLHTRRTPPHGAAPRSSRPTSRAAHLPQPTQGLQLKRHIDATLGQGDVLAAVRLPPGEDFREWLAVNTVRGARRIARVRAH